MGVSVTRKSRYLAIFEIRPFFPGIASLFLDCFEVTFQDGKKQFEHQLVHNNNKRRSIDKHNFTTTNNRMYYEITSINTVEITANSIRHITKTIKKQGFQQGVDLVTRETSVRYLQDI